MYGSIYCPLHKYYTWLKGHEIEVDWTDILIINGLVILVFRKLFHNIIPQLLYVSWACLVLFIRVYCNNNGTFTVLTDVNFWKPRQIRFQA